MNRIGEIISDLQETANHPAKAVKASMKETGKKAVGCFPYYTPDEIIYAAGMLPVGLWGGQTEIRGRISIYKASVVPSCASMSNKA